MKYQDLTRWYVVANRTHAAFYEESKSKLIAVLHFFDSKGRMTEKELDADRPGSFASGPMGVSHQTLDGNFNSYENVARRFARKIALQLDLERQKGNFGRVILVAEPKFMGVLKKELSPSLVRMIEEEVLRDYVYESEQDLWALITLAIQSKYSNQQEALEKRSQI